MDKAEQRAAEALRIARAIHERRPNDSFALYALERAESVYVAAATQARK